MAASAPDRPWPRPPRLLRHRGIVYAVAHKDGILHRAEGFEGSGLVFGQQAPHAGTALELLGHGAGLFLSVARKHGNVLHAQVARPQWPVATAA